MNDARIELRRFGLEAARIEHGELWDAWKVVEAKAQPTAAIAGVFLAGVFSYLAQLPAAATGYERLLLVVIVILLVGSIIEGLRAIWIVDVASPHIGAMGVEEIDAIIELTQPPDRLEARQENLMRDTTQLWLIASRDVRTALTRKGKLLKRSLLLLSWAAFVTMPLAVLTVATRVAV